MRTQVKLLATAAFLILIAVSNSFGALNMYLKLAGGGKTKIVQIKCPDGSCATTVDGLKAGKYTVSLCNAQGALMKVKEKGNRTKCTATLTYYHEVKSPRDAATGQASGKVVSPADETGIVSPRDMASGLSTGKRMHKSITITKELDAKSPFVTVVDLDEDGSVDFQKITWTWVDGGITAEDDWEAPVN